MRKYRSWIGGLTVVAALVLMPVAASAKVPLFKMSDVGASAADQAMHQTMCQSLQEQASHLKDAWELYEFPIDWEKHPEFVRPKMEIPSREQHDMIIKKVLLNHREKNGQFITHDFDRLWNSMPSEERGDLENINLRRIKFHSQLFEYMNSISLDFGSKTVLVYRVDMHDVRHKINDYKVDKSLIGTLFDDHDVQAVVARSQTDIPELNYTVASPSWGLSFEWGNTFIEHAMPLVVDPILAAGGKYDLFIYRDHHYLSAMPDGIIYELTLDQMMLTAKPVCAFDLTNPKNWH